MQRKSTSFDKHRAPSLPKRKGGEKKSSVMDGHGASESAEKTKIKQEAPLSLSFPLSLPLPLSV